MTPYCVDLTIVQPLHAQNLILRVARTIVPNLYHSRIE